MKIWRMKCEINKYSTLVFDTADDDAWEYFDSFDGRSHLNEKFKVKLYRETEKQKLPDLIYLRPCIPIVNDRILESIDKIIKNENVEVIPIEFEGKNIFALNVMNILDCFDREKSVYQTLPSGTPIFIKKYVLKEDVIKNKNIFKIDIEKLQEPYVSDVFKNIIDKNNFSGFDFELVYEG